MNHIGIRLKLLKSRGLTMISRIRLHAKYTANIILGQLLKIIWIIPIKKERIMFCSSAGRQYACNPKYIYEELIKMYPDTFEIIWVLNDKHNAPFNTVCVKRNSIPYCFYMLTSKVIIDNNGFGAFLPYRKEQLKINTWHASGAYKKVGLDAKLPTVEYKRLMREGKNTDILLSACKRFSEVFPPSYHISQTSVLEIGLPRNDILLQKNIDIKRSVFDKLGIDLSKKLVLYAPTFRGQSTNPERLDYLLDVEMCLNSLSERFGGDWIIGFRMHHTYIRNFLSIPNTISLSEYPDMQELLLSADVLITDYSSCMWDFSLLKKPCFIYASDLEKYKADVDFYTPINQWPFPLSRNNNQLRKNILMFQENLYIKAVKKHHNDLGIKETGEASNIMVNLIFDYCFNDYTKKDFLESVHKKK